MSDARCHTVLQVLDTRTNVHTRMLECDRNLARGRIGVLSMALHAPEYIRLTRVGVRLICQIIFVGDCAVTVRGAEDGRELLLR